MSLKTEDLKKFLSSDQISSDPQDLIKYSQDWLKQWPAQAGLVLFPKSAEDLVPIIHWARNHKYKLVPSGGRTGLSGGAVATQKEIVISFDKMNCILEFRPWENSVHVEAGCITAHLQEFAKSQGLYFPISFASQGSSQIGGNIATNVGGVHVIRYGTMKHRVLGLEVVTGRGEILKLGRGLVKNAVGYHLKDLFIGSEGTLGFITQAILSLVPPPDSSQVFLMALEKLDHLLTVFKEFKKQVQVLAFEFFTDQALKHVLSHGNLKCPLEKHSPFYILIEIEEKDSKKSLKIFEKVFEKALIQDGTLSQGSTQAKALWSLRENISEAISSRSPYKNDISIRLSEMKNFLKELDQLLKKHYPEFENIVFGHLGDGNLHINILKPEAWKREDFIKQCEKLNKLLFALVRKHKGSISAEHGIGLLKKDYLPYSCSQEEITLMKGIKKLFDPDNILNPGKIFDL